MDEQPKRRADRMASWRLEWLDGPEAGATWTMVDGELRSVGRSSQCGIQLNRKTISRTACTLRAARDGLWFEDLDPHVPTRVNETRVQPRASVRLTDGDVLQLGGARGGRLRITFAVGDSGPAPFVPSPKPEVRADVAMETDAATDVGTGMASVEASKESDVVRSFGPLPRSAPDHPSEIQSAGAGFSGTRMTTVPFSRPVDQGGSAEGLPTMVLDGGNAPETLVAGRSSRMHSAADPDATRYIPGGGGEEDPEKSSHTQVWDDDSPKQKRTWIVWVALALVALVWIGRPNTVEKDEQRIDLGVVQLHIPSDWKSESDSSGYHRLRPPGERGELWVRTVQNPELRWISFEEALEELRVSLPALPGPIGRMKWTPRTEAGSKAGALRLFADLESETWYSEMEGLASTEDGALRQVGWLRCWLCGDRLVVAIAWRSMAGDPDMIRQMFSAVRVVAVPGGVFDRRALSGAERDDGAISEWIAESERLLRERSVDPSNAWRAHEYAHRAWRRIQRNWRASDAFERDRVWSAVTASAEALQSEYLRLKFDAESMLRLGQTGRAAAICEYLQNTIPIRTDFRWQWAESRRVQASEN